MLSKVCIHGLHNWESEHMHTFIALVPALGRHNQALFTLLGILEGYSFSLNSSIPKQI